MTNNNNNNNNMHRMMLEAANDVAGAVADVDTHVLYGRLSR